MSTKAYLLPLDPKKNSTASVQDVNPPELWKRVPNGSKPSKVGQTHVFYDTPKEGVTALVSLGEGFDAKKADAKREVVRKAVGNAVKELKALDGLKEVHVDGSQDPQAAGETSSLSYPNSRTMSF